MVPVREHSDRDFKSAFLDFFVGDVTGSKGFLIVGDLLDTAVPGDPSLVEELADPSLVEELECRGGDVLDLEGGLVMGLGSLAFRGELELLLGCFAFEVDFSDSAEAKRLRSRSLKNLGKDGFLAASWSLPLLKLISQAWGDLPCSLSLLRASAEGDLKSTVMIDQPCQQRSSSRNSEGHDYDLSLLA